MQKFKDDKDDKKEQEKESESTKDQVQEQFDHFQGFSQKEKLKYYISFQFCQILNMLVLAFTWFITDLYLNSRFSTYGADVIAYFMGGKNYQKPYENPMNIVFPKKVNVSEFYCVCKL